MGELQAEAGFGMVLSGFESESEEFPLSLVSPSLLLTA